MMQISLIVVWNSSPNDQNTRFYALGKAYFILGSILYEGSNFKYIFLAQPAHLVAHETLNLKHILEVDRM